MPYLVIALAGGLLTLAGMRGCEKVIEMQYNEPPKSLAPNINMEKNIIVALVGAGATISAIFVAKKIFKED